MTTRQEILDFIREHPGVTSQDVGDHFNLCHRDASSRLKTITDLDLLTRKQVGERNGIVIWGYAIKTEEEEKPEPDTPPPEEPVAAIEPLQPLTDIAGLLADLAKVSRMISTIMGTVSTRLLPQALGEEIPEDQDSPRFAFPEEPEEEQEPEAPARCVPRIGIVGVPPSMAGLLNTWFYDKAELVFWYRDGLPRLRSMATSCEVIVVWKLIGHRETRVLSSERANWHMVRGGLDALTSYLTSYLQAVEERS